MAALTWEQAASLRVALKRSLRTRLRRGRKARNAFLTTWQPTPGPHGPHRTYRGTGTDRPPTRPRGGCLRNPPPQPSMGLKREHSSTNHSAQHPQTHNAVTHDLHATAGPRSAHRGGTHEERDRVNAKSARTAKGNRTKNNHHHTPVLCHHLPQPKAFTRHPATSPTPIHWEP